MSKAWVLFCVLATVNVLAQVHEQEHDHNHDHGQEVSHDHDHAHDANQEPPRFPTDMGTPLSPGLQELIRKEMLLLQDGMSGLSKAIPSGEWENAAKIAEQMRDSFILKKSLTPDQQRELPAKLPPEFLEADKKFHQIAAEMAEAVKAYDAEASIFLYTRLLESCTSCHAQFATDRFPGLTKATLPKKQD